MLDDYKKIYFDLASSIPDWESLSKNELCSKYIEYENNKDLAEKYLSAIIYRYWSLIDKFYAASYNACTAEDCYDWLIDSIMYALKHRRWLCPDSSIYLDKRGPDKVINRCMKCRRYTYYQAINRQKRKDDFNLLSLDKIKNDYEDNIKLIDVDPFISPNASDIAFIDYVKDAFNRKDYFVVFMLDFIANFDVFSFDSEQESMEFKQGRIVKYFNKIDDTYFKYFSETYDIDINRVKDAHERYIKNLTPTDIYQKLSRDLQKLKNDDYFKKLVIG